MSREQAFKDLFQGFSEIVKAWVFRTVLKIRCKSSSIYLKIKGVAVGTKVRYGPRSPAG